MKKILGLLLVSATVMSFADVAQPYNGSTAYINVNTGFATQANLPTGSYAITGNAGYNFNRGFALEGGYALLPSSQYGASVYTNLFDVAAKGTLPLSSIFSLYGRLGIGLSYFTWSGTASGSPNCLCNQQNSTNALALAGIGGSFVLSRHFDLRIEDTLYMPVGGGNQTFGNTNLILGGVQYNF